MLCCNFIGLHSFLHAITGRISVVKCIIWIIFNRSMRTAVINIHSGNVTCCFIVVFPVCLKLDKFTIYPWNEFQFENGFWLIEYEFKSVIDLALYNNYSIVPCFGLLQRLNRKQSSAWKFQAQVNEVSFSMSFILNENHHDDLLIFPFKWVLYKIVLVYHTPLCIRVLLLKIPQILHLDMSLDLKLLHQRRKMTPMGNSLVQALLWIQHQFLHSWFKYLT